MVPLVLSFLLVFNTSSNILAVKDAIVLFTYVKDDYGTYAPFSKKMICKDAVYDFSDNAEELFRYHRISCQHIRTEKLYDKLLSKVGRKNKAHTKTKLHSVYTVKDVDSMSIDYRLYSDNIFQNDKADTLTLAYRFSGYIIKIDTALCEHFNLVRPQCVVPESQIDYPLTFLYKIKRLSIFSLENWGYVDAKKSNKKVINVSFCD